MTKKEFFYELRKGLKAIDKDEQDKFISYYDEIIQDMIDGGMSESDAVEHQGNVSDIVEDILKDNSEKIVEKSSKRNKKIATVAIFMCIVLAVVIGVVINQKNKSKNKVEVSVSIKDESTLVETKEKNNLVSTEQVVEIIKDGDYDKALVEQKTLEVIELFANDDYDTIKNKYTSDIMATFFNDETMSVEKKKITDNWGSLKSSGSVYSCMINESGTDYIVCEVSCIFDNVTVGFRVVYNREYKIDGFFFQ